MNNFQLSQFEDDSSRETSTASTSQLQRAVQNSGATVGANLDVLNLIPSAMDWIRIRAYALTAEHGVSLNQYEEMADAAEWGRFVQDLSYHKSNGLASLVTRRYTDAEVETCAHYFASGHQSLSLFHKKSNKMVYIQLESAHAVVKAYVETIGGEMEVEGDVVMGPEGPMTAEKFVEYFREGIKIVNIEEPENLLNSYMNVCISRLASWGPLSEVQYMYSSHRRQTKWVEMIKLFSKNKDPNCTQFESLYRKEATFPEVDLTGLETIVESINFTKDVNNIEDIGEIKPLALLNSCMSQRSHPATMIGRKKTEELAMREILESYVPDQLGRTVVFTGESDVQPEYTHVDRIFSSTDDVMDRDFNPVGFVKDTWAHAIIFPSFLVKRKKGDTVTAFQIILRLVNYLVKSKIEVVLAGRYSTWDTLTTGYLCMSFNVVNPYYDFVVVTFLQPVNLHDRKGKNGQKLVPNKYFKVFRNAIEIESKDPQEDLDVTEVAGVIIGTVLHRAQVLHRILENHFECFKSIADRDFDRFLVPAPRQILMRSIPNLDFQDLIMPLSAKELKIRDVKSGISQILGGDESDEEDAVDISSFGF